MLLPGCDSLTVLPERSCQLAALRTLELPVRQPGRASSLVVDGDGPCIWEDEDTERLLALCQDWPEVSPHLCGAWPDGSGIPAKMEFQALAIGDRCLGATRTAQQRSAPRQTAGRDYRSAIVAVEVKRQLASVSVKLRLVPDRKIFVKET